ncbi:MAG TPA: hypothetical protein VF121_06865 [Thermoanaerobaculia bacterium]|nr:hypothetical protein [Thermoanaerobaculia bacterium]
MRGLVIWVLLVALALPALAAAQEQEPPPPVEDEEIAEPPAEETAPPPPAEEPAEEPVVEPAVEPAPEAAPASPDLPSEPPPPPPRDNGSRERSLPRLDVYFPEGDLDFRLSRLVNKVFFEGQVKYNFIDGDISAFLRYRYYGLERTLQFAVFDAIEFPDIEDFTDDFDRVRGVLLLAEWPRDARHRTFVLGELDRLSNNKEGLESQNNRTNTYVRLGYQLGTPEDARSNAIVGETRARQERLFTAFRDLGPWKFGFTGALTYGFDVGWGDFDYAKGELEALKRLDVTPHTFVIGRFHGGSFLRKRELARGEDLGEFERFNIPLSEFFRLDGREYLKGVKARLRGTEQLHTTWEYFFPWFLNAHHDFLRLDWQTWYWVLYAGAGTVGFDRSVYTDISEYVPDVGVGFESSFRFRRKYPFFLSGIVAQALKGDDGVEARISVKSYR